MIKSYNDLKLTVKHQTPDPNDLLRLASNITQKRNFDESGKTNSAKLASYLIKANHHSLFEHMSITFLIENVSRSFLAQITRHRMASYTAASQHYQEYSDYDDIVHPELAANKALSDILAISTSAYIKLIYDGIKPEEARQVLPNSKAVNLLWTINARSLINFLNLRMCKRNTFEMYNFAHEVWHLALNWWPEVFIHIGPDCMSWGRCRQGPMRAKECKKDNQQI